MKLLPAIAAAALLAGASASDVTAQLAVGPQLSYGTTSDLGAGVRATIPLPRLTPSLLSGTADYFFGDERPGRDITWVEIAGGLVLPLGIDTPYEGDGYVGAGAGLAFVTDDSEEVVDGDTDLYPGLNFVAGWRAETANFASFVELRGTIGAAGQILITAGLLFGGGR